MYLNFLECIDKLEKLDSLLYLEKTGTPKELAYKLNISERQLYRLISLMKNLGADIKYCSSKCSYKYEIPMKFQLGFQYL